MKRFLGYIFAAIGAALGLWGAYHVVSGRSDVVLFGVAKALYIGLAGIALFTLGLASARD